MDKERERETEWEMKGEGDEGRGRWKWERNMREREREGHPEGHPHSEGTFTGTLDLWTGDSGECGGPSPELWWMGEVLWICYASWGPIFLGTPPKPWQLKAPGPRPTIQQLKEARKGNRWPRNGNGPPPPPVTGTDGPFNYRKCL